MSEEVVEKQEETAAAPEEAAESTEKKSTPEQADADGSTDDGKKKKINRLTKEELNKKIEALETSGFTSSKYFKHLMQRKRELEQLES